MSKIRIVIGSILVAYSTAAIAMVFDNRFFPLFQRPHTRYPGRQSNTGCDLFFTTGHKAFGDLDDKLGVPELFGQYDLKNLDAALRLTGRKSPLRTEWVGYRFPFHAEGKIQGQGISFFHHQSITNTISCGVYWMWMKVRSGQFFFLDENDMSLVLTPSEKEELKQTRRKIHTALGFKSALSHQNGFGDMDAYVRVGNIWDYTCKCRQIDAGVTLGTLIPSGVRPDEAVPASVPFGGDGHWGFYVQADCDAELKEDLRAGFLLRVSKRVSRTALRRVPLSGEPSIFGGLLTTTTVSPGATVVFAPYLAFENLRAGLGARVGYVLTAHGKDHWGQCVRRTPTGDQVISLAKVVEHSSWSSDYVVLSAFYDFGKEHVVRGLDPIVSISWDVPLQLFVGEKVVRTHKITCGIEVNF